MKLVERLLARLFRRRRKPGPGWRKKRKDLSNQPIVDRPRL